MERREDSGSTADIHFGEVWRDRKTGLLVEVRSVIGAPWHVVGWRPTHSCGDPQQWAVADFRDRFERNP